MNLPRLISSRDETQSMDLSFPSYLSIFQIPWLSSTIVNKEQGSQKILCSSSEIKRKRYTKGSSPFSLFFFSIEDVSFAATKVKCFLIYLYFCAQYVFPENFGLVNLIKNFKHNNSSNYRCLEDLKAVIFRVPDQDFPLLIAVELQRK